MSRGKACHSCVSGLLEKKMRGEEGRRGERREERKKREAGKGKQRRGEQEESKDKERNGEWTGVGRTSPSIAFRVESDVLFERGRGTSAMVKGSAYPPRSPHSCRLMDQTISIPHR